MTYPHTDVVEDAREAVGRVAGPKAPTAADVPPPPPTAKKRSVDRQETAATEASDAPSFEEAHDTSYAVHGDSREEGEARDNATLLSRATDLRRDGRLLEAARVLRRVSDPTLLRRSPYADILRRARHCEDVVADLSSPLDGDGDGDGDEEGGGSGWTKQGERHGRRHSLVYYRMEDDTGPMKLRVRVETPIEPSLLVPLLSVLNESELYATWLPSWSKPVKLGVSRSDKLRQNGRADQTVLVTGYLPWPLSPREVVIDAIAFDDIGANGLIGVKLMTLETGQRMGSSNEGRNDEAMSSDVVPPPARGAVQVDFDGGFLFRRCPSDHPALRGMDDGGKDGTNQTEDEKEKKEVGDREMLLVTFSMYVDAKINFMPASVINFVVRTVIGRMWDMFLAVAEDVRDGKRPRHEDAIEKKKESLYDWVEERVREMFERLQQRDDNLSRNAI